jgi:hypothetical protein
MEMTVVGIESINVPAGTYPNAVKISYKLTPIYQGAPFPLSVTYDVLYVDGIGCVRWVDGTNSSSLTSTSIGSTPTTGPTTTTGGNPVTGPTTTIPGGNLLTDPTTTNGGWHPDAPLGCNVCASETSDLSYGEAVLYFSCTADCTTTSYINYTEYVNHYTEDWDWDDSIHTNATGKLLFTPPNSLGVTISETGSITKAGFVSIKYDETDQDEEGYGTWYGESHAIVTGQMTTGWWLTLPRPTSGQPDPWAWCFSGAVFQGAGTFTATTLNEKYTATYAHQLTEKTECSCNGTWKTGSIQLGYQTCVSQ